MGERGLVLVQVDKKIKVAQYFQWAGPEGLGMQVKEFVAKTMKNYKDIENIKNCFRNCKFISNEEVDKRRDAEKDAFEEKYPQFSPDDAFDILSYIVDKGGCELGDHEGFADNSLFCEWAYLVNFDTEKVEFYKGFNREPLTEEDRFYKYMDEALKWHELRTGGREPDPAKMEEDEEYRAFEEEWAKPYYPVKMVFEIPFAELAKMAKRTFLKMFKPHEKED